MVPGTMRAWVLAGFAIAAVGSGCRSRALDPGGQGTLAGAAGTGGGSAGDGAGDGGAGRGGAVADGGYDLHVLPPDWTRTSCASADECASGFCVDGVCCENACPNECARCDFPGLEGTCVMKVAGDTPRRPDACPTQPQETCSFDGTCDGQGGCRLWPQNSVCGVGHCDGDAVVGVSVCDGAGHCKLGPTRICAPYSCDPAAGLCNSRCSTDAECSGSGCDALGRCRVHLVNGLSCQRNDECASGFCASGVCCQTACSGPCLSCREPDHLATCWPVAGSGCAADAGSDAP
jgi:hypothetical protein